MANRAITRALGLLVSICLASGQILRFGHCPYFSPLKDFEINKYLGTWYQIERYFSFPGISGKCWTQNYFPDEEVPGKYKLRMDFRDPVVENKLTVETDIYQDFPEDPATLTSQFFGIPLIAYGYQVLSTDYTNYAIEWRCEERGLFQHRESLWILSRTPYPKAWIVKQARSVVESLGLKMTSLRAVSQDCHLPPALRTLRPFAPQNRNQFNPSFRL